MPPFIPILIAGAAAGAIILIALGLSMGSNADPVQARLTQLGTMNARNLEELELQQPFAERTIRPMITRLSRVGRRTSSAQFAERTDKRLALAGNPNNLRSSDWVGVKVGAAIIFALFFFLIFMFVMGAGLLAIIFGPVGGMIGYIGPEFWLSRKIKARQKAILLQIPDALDLLTISVRAGLGFDAALAKVVEKMKGPLVDEFRRALAEVRVGKTRRDALRDMIPRTEVPALSNFIGAIIQAEQLGVSISKVLQVQSEQLRIERRQRAEEMAAKAPIKMLIPLVGCIFPALFITILGPAIILILLNFTQV